MGSRINRDSWNIIERVIRRYPEQKQEYDDAIASIQICGHSSCDGQPRGNAVGNPVERIVMEKDSVLNSPRMKRIARELLAVGSTYDDLTEEHRKVIRIRFWSNRYKNISYLRMEKCVSYSERQMKRICAKFIRDVGKKLGEI